MCKIPWVDQSVVSDEGLSCLLDSGLAVGCEGQVGGTCVSSVERPFGFAVADDENPGSCHGLL